MQQKGVLEMSLNVGKRDGVYDEHFSIFSSVNESITAGLPRDNVHNSN